MFPPGLSSPGRSRVQEYFQVCVSYDGIGGTSFGQLISLLIADGADVCNNKILSLYTTKKYYIVVPILP